MTQFKRENVFIRSHDGDFWTDLFVLDFRYNPPRKVKEFTEGEVDLIRVCSVLVAFFLLWVIVQ